MSGKIDKVNANGITYAVEPVVSRKIQQGDHLPASSGAVWDALHEDLETAENAQPIQLDAPVTVAGVQCFTVEDAFKALQNNITDSVTQGSQKFLTVRGATADKSNDVKARDGKCITAGGVYAWFGKCTSASRWLSAALGNHS